MSDKPCTRPGSKTLKPHVLALMLGLLVAACSFDIEEARNLSIEGGDFNHELAREYRDIALYEADEMYDWPDAALFSRKAILASTGQITAPENIGDWNISEDAEADFSEARSLLVDSLEAGFRDQIPDQAASAQASFDCWIEQQEEGWQIEHIAKCRQNFRNAMKDWVERRQAANALEPNILSPILVADITPNIDRSEPVCLSGENASHLPSHNYLIQFRHNSAQLDVAADAALSESAFHARGVETVEVFIEGHADLSGTTYYNLDLSLKRALAVWNSMIALGVSPDKMWIGPRGELQPISNVSDGTRNSQDRRVALILTGKPSGELVGADECANQQTSSPDLAGVPDLLKEPNE